MTKGLLFTEQQRNPKSPGCRGQRRGLLLLPQGPGGGPPSCTPKLSIDPLQRKKSARMQTHTAARAPNLLQKAAFTRRTNHPSAAPGLGGNGGIEANLVPPSHPPQASHGWGGWRRSSGFSRLETQYLCIGRIIELFLPHRY